MAGGHGANGPGNPFEEMLRLQSNFHQSLAQATMSYLRQLQGMIGPVVPGTLVDVVDGQGASVTIRPGATERFEVSVENRQRVHTLVTPMLSPLVNDSGVTWFPEVETEPTSRLLATDESCDFRFTLRAPEDAPVGVFRGACLLYGCADGVVPVSVTIDTGPAAARRRKTGRAGAPATTGSEHKARSRRSRKSR